MNAWAKLVMGRPRLIVDEERRPRPNPRPVHRSTSRRPDGREPMDFDAYRQAYFVDPPPPQRHRFSGSVGVTVYFEDFERAVGFYTRVLGPPHYVEGDGTRGWPIGSGW